MESKKGKKLIKNKFSLLDFKTKVKFKLKYEIMENLPETKTKQTRNLHGSSAASLKKSAKQAMSLYKEGVLMIQANATIGVIDGCVI